MNENSELRTARRIVEETGSNLFLTGKAGTGKTTFLKNLRERSAKRMVVLAPTGVAAINAGGVTIHSFFQFDFSPYIPGRGFLSGEGRKYSFSKQKRKIINALDLLVIDEISMVRPDILDAIDATLRRFRNPTLPFGGLQLLLIGDLRQLAPVLTGDESEALKPYYDSPYFFSSHALREAGFLTVELTEVFRQEDADFIGLLNAVRDGAATGETLARLNTRYIPDFNPPEREGYIRLTSHNRMASYINERRLADLAETPRSYSAAIKGNFPESSYPAERVLTLKVGAQVMFIKNDSGEDRRFYNGMIGRVIGLAEDTVTVLPSGGTEPVEAVPEVWENIKYDADPSTGDISQRVEGTFTQIPLRLAWAITIHKSQGLTFEKAIIDAAQSFAPGQTYVALSRCKTLEGMVLGQQLPPSAIITDGAVSSFINDEARRCPSRERVDALSREFCRRQLAELFDFSLLQRRLADFSRAVQEYIGPIHPNLYSEYGAAEKEFAERVVAVGSRFIQLYASRPLESGEFETNGQLREKISGGSLYFLAELKKLVALVKKTPTGDVGNRSYLERINNAFEAFSLEFQLKNRVLTEMSEHSFSTSAYSRAKALALLNAGEAPSKAQSKRRSETKEKAQKSKTEKAQKPVQEKKPKGYSVVQSVRMFSSGLSIEDIAAQRELVPSTIAAHLGQGLKNGLISPEEVFEPEVLRWLVENYPPSSPRPSAQDFFSDAEKVMDPMIARVYFKFMEQ